jgi:hypothetical protein
VGIQFIRQSIRAGAVAVALASASAAQAAVIVYGGTLTGLAEAPPNNSPGVGTTVVSIDPVTHQLTLTVNFSGLVPTTAAGAPSGTTAAHIHAATAVPFTGTAGVATQLPSFIGFPLGVRSGSFSQTFNTLDPLFYNPAYVTANGGTTATAESALFSAIGSGRAYLNIHTNAFPGGEIRAFLVPVPEPGTWAMMLIGFGAIGWSIRRRRPSLAAA